MKLFNIKSLISLLVFQLIILFFCLLICLTQKIVINKGIYIFLFQLVGLLIPGYLIYSILKEASDDLSEVLSWSYLFGIILDVVYCHVLIILNNNLIVKILFFVLIVILLCAYAIKKKNITINKTSDVNTIYVFVIFVICFFGITLFQTTPELSNGTYYFNDSLFWFGNSISFLKGLPVNDFRLVGNTFYYHQLSNAMIAFESMITNVDINTISLYFSYIVPIPFLVFSGYTLLKRLIKNRKLLCFGLFVVLFTECNIITYSSHLIFNPFGFDYGFAFGMLSIAFLIDMINENDYSIKNVIISSILIAVTTGMKGPIAVVVLMGFGIVAFSLLIQKDYKHGLICGFSWLLSFLLMYIFVVSGMMQESDGGNPLSFVGLIGGFDLNKGPMYIHSDLIAKYGFQDTKLLKLFAIGLFVLLSNKACMLSLIIGIVYVLVNIKNKNDKLQNIILIAICLWGIILTLVTHQDGNSQWYFIMSTIPYGLATGLNVIDQRINNRKILNGLFES